jgi:site-specific recombinase XerD
VVGPQPTDPVEAWLADGIAAPLRSAGIATLTDLASLVDARGARWHTRVKKLGPAKATAVTLWLRANVAGFGERIGERDLIPYKDLRPTLVARRPKATGVVPYEYFQPTADTDGFASPFRRPPAAGGLSAVDDRDAVARWLMTHLTAPEVNDPLCWEKNATYRAYRREVERLWAWAVVQRNKALSALTDEDVQAYQTFLLDLQPRALWVGAKRPRWHPDWRPFTALPSPASREHILTVIGALFDWWFRQGYIARNPWRAGPKRTRIEQPQFAERSLSLAAWNELREYVSALGAGEKRERLRALLALLYSTGLRRAEVAAATVQSLKSHPDDSGEPQWELKVLGKGKRSRTVPVAAPVMAALQDYFAQRLGHRRWPRSETPVRLFATLPLPKRPRQPLSAWGINRAVSEAFLAASREQHVAGPRLDDVGFGLEHPPILWGHA